MGLSKYRSEVRTEEAKREFEKKIGSPEALALSLAIVGPSMAMAFHVPLVVRAAGRAAPLAFAIGTVTVGMVAVAFVRFSRRLAHAGSAYAYTGHAFGRRWGPLAGWTLWLTYLIYAAGSTALIGSFFQAAAQYIGVRSSGVSLAATVTGLLIAAFCAYREVKLASRVTLVLDALSVAAIIFLSVAILTRLSGTGALSISPFKPASDKHGSGIGYALVFCVLSFAGFEGAATLGEETHNPHRDIPIAILGTCATRIRCRCFQRICGPNALWLGVAVGTALLVRRISREKSAKVGD